MKLTITIRVDISLYVYNNIEEKTNKQNIVYIYMRILYKENYIDEDESTNEVEIDRAQRDGIKINKHT